MQCSSSHDLLLPQINVLAIEGEGAAEPAVANLVNACSALVQLKLDSSFTFDFGLTLPLLQSNIESLCLCASSEEFDLDGSNSGIDDHLIHFTHLTTLELPYGVISSRTPSTLLNLPNLVNLVLGNSEVEVSALLPLIEGRGRLPHLKRITLNDEDFEIRDQFNPTAGYSKNHFLERNDYPLFRWTRTPWSDPSQRWRDLINLELAGRRNGVMIEGVGGAEQGLRDYALEKHNLAIAQAFYHFDFSYVHEARTLAALLEVQLPLIGMDIFNRNTDEVELVKVEMKGSGRWGWFALTVRRKVSVRKEHGNLEEVSNDGTTD